MHALGFPTLLVITLNFPEAILMELAFICLFMWTYRSRWYQDQIISSIPDHSKKAGTPERLEEHRKAIKLAALLSVLGVTGALLITVISAVAHLV